MSLSFMDITPQEPAIGNSSALSAGSFQMNAVVHGRIRHGQYDVEPITASYTIHKSMLASSGSKSETVQPICQVHFHSYPGVLSSNSSSGTGIFAEQYSDIERRLTALSAGGEMVPFHIEEAAISSALTVVDHLRRNQIAPPELSWHGGDAVVMLWSLGDTTYAITVTDGELGFVVRRNKKAVRMADSISLNSFRLSDLR